MEGALIHKAIAVDAPMVEMGLVVASHSVGPRPVGGVRRGLDLG